MALKFSGADRDDIKKMGWWSSDAFLSTYVIRLRSMVSGIGKTWQSHNRISIWRMPLFRG